MAKRYHLQVDIKPFIRNNIPYSGLYTLKGARNKRARIEVNEKSSEFDQIGSHAHEHGHFLWDIYSGDAICDSAESLRREHMFCVLYDKAARELWKRMKDGALEPGKVKLTLELSEDEL